MLRIKDKITTYDLKEVLECLKPALQFATISFQYVGDVTTANSETYQQYQKLNADNNITLTFAELEKLSLTTVQVIDIEFTAKTAEAYAIITAFDSTYWEVDTNIPEIEVLLRGYFNEIEIL